MLKDSYPGSDGTGAAAGSGQSWFVYIMECNDGSFYTGITNNIERRQQQHNDGTASRY
ncbi:MAG: GIY-YIG nuclease family protein, partial [Sulfuricaulis sp.]